MAENEKQIKLLGYIKITGEIEALTGLHIGGTADSIDKGGIDNPVIKNPVTNEPYIPGSSLRGRMRSLLEKRNALLNKTTLKEMTKGIWMEVYNDETKAMESEVCRVFGNSMSDRNVPSVLIVRDALYSDDTRNNYMQGGKGGLPITEAKMEIAVDRITAHALPRTIERVPAGARFNFEIIYKVQTYENGKFEATFSNANTKSDDKLKDDLKNILWALEQIETHDGLGGNTSRGHGQVKIYITELTPVDFRGNVALTTTSEESNCNKMMFSDWCEKIVSISYAKDVENQKKEEEPEQS